MTAAPVLSTCRSRSPAGSRFDAGVLEFVPRLRSFIRRRVRDDATAANLTRETLLKVYRSRAALGRMVGYERRRRLCCDDCAGPRDIAVTRIIAA